MLPFENASDRRQHDRRLLRTPAWVSPPAGPTIKVRTIDISSGGVGIVVDLKPPIGARLEVRLMLAPPGTPQPQEFRATTRVAHAMYVGKEGGFLAGLEFVDMSPEARRLLGSYVE